MLSVKVATLLVPVLFLKLSNNFEISLITENLSLSARGFSYAKNKKYSQNKLDLFLQSNFTKISDNQHLLTKYTKRLIFLLNINH